MLKNFQIEVLKERLRLYMFSNRDHWQSTWLDSFTSGFQCVNILLALRVHRYKAVSLKQKILDS